MWMMWFIRLFPARDSGCRTVFTDEALSRRSGPGREPVAVGEPGNATDDGEDADGEDGPDGG